jgi:hypothetical protein
MHGLTSLCHAAVLRDDRVSEFVLDAFSLMRKEGDNAALAAVDDGKESAIACGSDTHSVDSSHLWQWRIDHLALTILFDLFDLILDDANPQLLKISLGSTQAHFELTDPLIELVECLCDLIELVHEGFA